MVQPELAQYVKIALGTGASETDVRNLLAKQGWHRDEIDEAFALAHPQKSTNDALKIGLIILSLVIVGIVSFALFRNYYSITSPDVGLGGSQTQQTAQQVARQEPVAQEPTLPAEKQQISECTQKEPGNWCYTLVDEFGSGSTCAPVRDACESLRLSDVAVKQKNPALCNEAQDKDACLTTVAANLKDVRVCELSTVKDRCYHFYAFATRDASVCEKITDQGEQASCKSSAQ